MSSVRRMQPSSQTGPQLHRAGYGGLLRMAVPGISMAFILYILLRDLF
ncbi:hypothetical protein [Neorhizobium galegae]|nr:hypothetical protein [Neorhizobium galegae]MCM2496510.1 hypothetical protein [Neorhizobium galegae]MCQ1770337.1 hypothetical protein [Neorhizobium galegae]MCQ1777259.1 hypothetical protein [Neorhizobium galegae]MCQ1798326.1 hypothetical protein [Neorhizobium galegae]